MTKRNVLLLNPPGSKFYIRDYYCSKVSKGDYIYHPVDLLMLSGLLHQDLELQVYDAIVERASQKEAYARVTAMDADIIIFLTGAVSWHEDFPFMERIARVTNATMVATGDIFLDLKQGQRILDAYPFLDAALLDFTDESVVRFLQGKRSDLTNMIYRKDGQVIAGPVRREKGRRFEIPIPRYELFPNKLYTYPFVKQKPFATVLTDFGCPWKCTFCVISILGYKYQPVDRILEEFRYIKSLGIHEIYFSDQTFGLNRPRTLELLRRMREEKLDFGWVCFSRADIVDEELLTTMREAGCHTIMFGVESANQSSLDNVKKGLELEKVAQAFRLCQKLNVRTVGTFILGLPGENFQDGLRTIDLAKSLKCDYASFNLPVPKMGTPFRDLALEKGWSSPDLFVMDQSGTTVAMETNRLTRDDLLTLRKIATRRFYFRPTYLLKRLLSIRTKTEAMVHIRGALRLIVDYLKPYAGGA